MSKETKKYKWSSPYEWLSDKAYEWDEKRLRCELLNLAILHDSDTLQDQYQPEMANDGYFEEEI